MKNRTTRRSSTDERAITSQGRVSKSRVIVLEALDTQGKEGATIDELATLIGQDMPGENPKLSIGSVLSRMEVDEYVVCYRNRWYLKEHFRNMPPPATVVVSNGASRTQVAPLVQKRSGRKVSLYTTPTVFLDVISLALLIKEQWIEIPFFDSIRVCQGHDIPDWSADKRWYYNVTTMKLTFKGGQVEERHPDSKDVITIDAEE